MGVWGAYLEALKTYFLHTTVLFLVLSTLGVKNNAVTPLVSNITQNKNNDIWDAVSSSVGLVFVSEGCCA